MLVVNGPGHQVILLPNIIVNNAAILTTTRIQGGRGYKRRVYSGNSILYVSMGLTII